MPVTTRSKKVAEPPPPPPPPPPQRPPPPSPPLRVPPPPDPQKLIKSGKFDEFKALIDSGTVDVNTPPPQKEPLLKAAVDANKNEFVKQLIEKGADPNIKVGKKRQPLLSQAMVSKLFDIVQTLLDAPTLQLNAIDQDGDTPLHVAVLKFQEDTMRKIIAKYPKGVNQTNIIGESPYVLSWTIGDQGPLRVFLEKPQLVTFLTTQGGEHILSQVISNHDEMELQDEILAVAPQLLNIPDHLGASPLQRAVMVKNFAAVNTLLKQPKLDINYKFPETGATAIMYLVQQSYVSKVMDEFLKSPTIDLKIQSKRGSTVLLFAVFRGNLEAAQKLIAKDPETVRYVDAKGSTLLHQAAAQNQPEMVKLFLEKGVDPSVKDNEGHTAADVATSEEVKNLLSEKEAPSEPQKGYTKTDADLFNQMFEEPNEWSYCPVCLAQVRRSDGCMQMRHICVQADRHEALFQKFKDVRQKPEGEIEWCTICGRVTQGHKHQEHSLAKASEMPPFAKISATAPEGAIRHFDSDCTRVGGGGFEEKVRRTHRLLSQACELQDEVGKMPSRQARRELVEEVWNAGDIRNRKVASMISNKKFEFPCTFPEDTAPVAEAEKEYPDIPRPDDQKDLVPIKHEAPDNDCIVELGPHEDNRPVQEFQHKQADGSVVKHPFICGEDLETLMNAQTIDGKCYIEPDKCKALLYPEELKGIVSPEFEAKQRRLFNKANAKVGGGNGSLLKPLNMDTATCAPPQKAARRKTRRVKKGRRKTIKA